MNVKRHIGVRESPVRGSGSAIGRVRVVGKQTRARLRRTTSTLAVAVGCGLLLPLAGGAIPPAFATDYYWDINGATAGAGGATPAGTWSTTDTTLSTDSTGSSAVGAHTTTTSDRAFFSAGTDASGNYAVTVDGTQNINSLIFQDGTVTLTGGTINFGASSGLVQGASAGDANTISSVIAGTGGVRFSNGTFTLNSASANTYTGTTQVGGAGLSQATLLLNASGGNAINGNNLQLGGNNGTSAGFVRLDASNQINDTATVRLNAGHYSGSSVFSMNGFDETIGGISLHKQGAGSSVTFRNGAATDSTVTLAGSGTYTTISGDRTAGRNIIDGSTGKLHVVVALTGSGMQTFGGTDARYTGTTTITSGTLRLFNTSAWASDATVNGGTLQLHQQSASVPNLVAGAATRTHARTIGGTGGTLQKTGDGTVILTGANTYQGATQIDQGTLRAGSATAFGSNSAVTLANVSSATMDLNNFDIVIGSLEGGGTTGGTVTMGTGDLTTGGDNTSTLYGGVISGSGLLTKVGIGTQILTGDNTYGGTTTISAGTLQLGDGGSSGSIVGDVTNNSVLAFERSDTVSFDGLISGTGAVQQDGTGTTVLTGDNSYLGATEVNAGTLRIDGDQSAAIGLTTVFSGAVLGGSGIVGGNVLVASGGMLSPGSSPGTLTINGDLMLNSGSVLDFEFGQANVAGGALNDLIVVNGDLGLDGTIEVSLSAGGSLDPGVYRVIDYAGSLTDNGLLLGAMPGGTLFEVQTAVAGQVNLVNTFGQTLFFWDGPAGPKNDGLIQGGAGTWRLGGGNSDWTNVTGAANSDYQQDAFAVFSGAPGTVTVDDTGGTVGISGMQFTVDGYVVDGDALTLAGAQTDIRVGDGTAAGTAMTATIDSALGGAGQLVKTDLGTLVLNGANTYTGGTLIEAGVLQISSDANLGDTSGGLEFDGGTLQTTATMSSARTVTLTGDGAFLTDAGTTLTLSDGIAGAGGLDKQGAGSLVLTGNATHTGGTTISAGMLQLGDGGTAGALTGDVVNNSILAFDRSDAVVFSGAILGTGQVQQNGGGTTILTGDSTYTGVTTINAGTLQLGNGGTSGSIVGDVVDNGTFAVSSSDIMSFGGVISGTGTLEQNGTGTTILSADNTYTGGTTVSAGTLQLGNGGTSGSIVGDVVDNGTFAVSRSDIMSFSGVISGTGTFEQIGTGTTILTGDNIYSGGTTIGAGTLQLGNGGTSGSIAGDVVDNSILAFNRSDTLTYGGLISGTGVVNQIGTGTTILTAENTYSGGTTISAGTLQLGNGGTSGSIAGDVVDNGTFAVSRSDIMTFSGVISGTGTLEQNGTGTTILSADNTYTGGTTVSAGTLQLGNGGTSGSIVGDVVDNGTFAVSRSDIMSFSGVISGTGTFEQIGTGTTILTGDNIYSGVTDVLAGSLIVDGDQSGATGLTSVLSGAILGGTGIVGGDVIVANGGAINPGEIGNIPGELTILGNLSLGSGSVLNYDFGQAGVVGGAFNDLIAVGGDLTLDGTLAITTSGGGTFGPGIYRVMNYDGALTNNGLSIASPDYFVQTSVANQVNLVNSAGLTLSFWDGDAGPHSDGTIDGGTGAWRASGDQNWADDTGIFAAPFANGSFAIFQGAPGVVTVDNDPGTGDVTAAGMQFVVDGYVVNGEPITLTGTDAIIRVGDGTLAGAGYVATINADMAGSSWLVKTDLGTLVLGGTNSYSGGTAIDGGTLQVSANASLGDLSGGLSFDGGTLQNTAAFTSSRSATLDAGGGTFQTDADLTLSGVIDGTGGLTKDGSDALILTGANSYSGTTTVEAGSLFVNGDQTAATGSTFVDAGATLGGVGIIGGDVDIASAGILSPGDAGSVAGTLTILGNLALGSSSVLNYSFGEAAVVGGTLNDLTIVGGDLILNGTLNVAVSAGGTFGPGVYRVFSYGGALTDNGLSIGTIPSGSAFVQTSIANQVNLVNTAGLILNYWDGDAGPKNNGAVNGGNGAWQAPAGNDNWTDSTGSVNAPYTDAVFAVFAGAPGVVTVDNMLGDVAASGMQFATDGYSIQGESITLVGPSSILRVGDGTAAGADYTATIAAVLGGSSQLVKTDLGTLVLTGNNTYTGGTRIEGGIIEVTSDSNLGATSGGLAFDGGTLHATASFASARSITMDGQGTLVTDAGETLTLAAILSGSGTLIKDGDGKTLLTGDGSLFTGTTSIESGVLSVNGNLCGDVNVLSGGRLEGTGTVCDTNNFDGGTIAPGNSIGTITVAGDYTGIGGLLEMEAVLGTDASPTDLLHVTGNTSGPTNVQVINLGGIGGATVEGIRIVQVDGTSAGTFTLLGDYVFNGDQAVVGGAYAYRLYQGSTSAPADGDWYLRSNLLVTDPGVPPDEPPGPLFQVGVPIYESYPHVLQTFAALDTMRRRLGNRSRYGDAGVLETDAVIDDGAVWWRAEGDQFAVAPQVSTTSASYAVSTGRLQVGIDTTLAATEAGKLVAGISIQYGTAVADVSSMFGDGNIASTGLGVGGTLTFHGNGGFYLDGQGLITATSSTLSSTLAAVDLVTANTGLGYGLSLEAGQKVVLSEGFSITPQAQIAYSSVAFDGFDDAFGAPVSLTDGDRLRARLGLSADFESEWQSADGDRNTTHLYGVANLYYDILGGTEVTVAGTPFASRNDPLSGGLGIGGSLSLNDDAVSLHGEALVTSDFSGANLGVSATGGLRVRW